MPRAVPLDRIWAFDFETTGPENLIRDGRVRVWLWSLVNCETKEKLVGYDIDSFMQEVRKRKVRMCYAHNLRFDGSFILHWCLSHEVPTSQIIDGHSHSWFSLTVNGCEFRDSYKKFPMTLRSLAYALGLEAKLDGVDFARYRPAGYIPTFDEIRYCVRDAEIVADAISMEFAHGRMRLSASSEAYHQLQQTIPRFDKIFPRLSMQEDAFVRPSYAGGVCLCDERFQGQDLEGVYVYDINSSYPSQMAYRPMPYGYGYFEEPKRRDQLFVVNFWTEFSLKDKHVPSILSTRNLRYATRSDNFIRESDGPTELTMTSVDYDLFHKQYDIDYEIEHRWVTYDSEVGICKPFIDQEMEGKNAAPSNSYDREKHKLNMNMSYGSFGINPNAWKVKPMLVDDIIVYDQVPEQRFARYSVYASFVTAYGRKQLVEAAQANYDNFIYSDTDSIHLLKPAKGIEQHDKKLGAWKRECWAGYDCFPHAKYLRPKCYCHADEDHVIFQRDLPDGRLAMELKCAGVPDAAKRGLTWDTFNLGTVVHDKLQQCLVPGGACLLPTTYTI